MKLHVKSIGEGKPLVVLHGLFGSGDNWLTIANYLAEQGYLVHLLDQRNHGRSPHDPVMDYASMAVDVQDFITGHSLEDVVLIGHSMGGKTVMRHAQLFPASVSRIVIVDIAPRSYPPHHQAVFKALNDVHLGEIKTRKAVEEVLKHTLNEKSTVDFLMKNLYWVSPEQLGWRFNLKGIERALPRIGEALPSLPSVTIPACFILGENSEYVSGEDQKSIHVQFTEATIRTVSGAGHWVHADQPLLFTQTLLDFLRQ
jgi:esterase